MFGLYLYPGGMPLSQQRAVFGLVPAVNNPIALDFQTACGEISYGLGEKPVFDFQYPCGNVVGRVVVENRYDALGDNRAAVQLGGNERCSRPRGNLPLTRVRGCAGR